MMSLVLAATLSCPTTPLNPFGQFPQKFPLDMVIPNDAELAEFNQYQDGCFLMNVGGGDRTICAPGQIVTAIKPFLIIGVGLRFIFSD
ncbi:hypothetical protein [Limnoraphis robusta]|nr:hypothetical protein [Limnoraphis robusta]